MARLIDYDPVTRTRTLFHYDNTEDVAILETVQDVGDVIEATKSEYNAHSHKDKRWRGDWHKVASIPMSVITDYKRKGIDLMKDDAALKRFLNDRDNGVFRTRPGRV